MIDNAILVQIVAGAMACALLNVPWRRIFRIPKGADADRAEVVGIAVGFSLFFCTQSFLLVLLIGIHPRFALHVTLWQMGCGAPILITFVIWYMSARSRAGKPAERSAPDSTEEGGT